MTNYPRHTRAKQEPRRARRKYSRRRARDKRLGFFLSSLLFELSLPCYLFPPSTLLAKIYNSFFSRLACLPNSPGSFPCLPSPSVDRPPPPEAPFISEIRYLTPPAVIVLHLQYLPLALSTPSSYPRGLTRHHAAAVTLATPHRTLVPIPHPVLLQFPSSSSVTPSPPSPLASFPISLLLDTHR